MRVLVGIDDTDSSSGSCTTYLAYRIARDLRPVLRVVAYPRLVRLNPNVPFKTRGNAAVCLPIDTEAPEEAFERITSLVSALSDVDHGANSGVVFLEDLALVVELKDLYQRAVTGLVNRHRVEKLLREHRVRTFTLGNGMGIVGAASSLPFCEEADHTYELIAYRRQENRGLKRFVEPRSVEEMDRETFPHTFNNFDYQKKKVLVAPHGPDPVFVGIRGDSPAAVVSAFARLRYKERLEGYMVYLSNQYTDAHLTKALDWKVYSSGWVEGTVQLVSVGPGGHLFIAVAEGSEKRICAVYEPTGDLRRAMKLLGPGDTIRAYGGVRRGTTSHPKVLNAEKVAVISTAVRLPRSRLVTGTYVASPRANRHLTKPLIRFGRETAGKESPLIRDWFSAAPTTMPVPARNR
ncbi:MAG TPA: DUF1743 domain-containing protein [Nitrososphaerales archaeon]|nr:DUF1743 domain-containing protein [Nitrososphaerales archaeon]